MMHKTNAEPEQACRNTGGRCTRSNATLSLLRAVREEGAGKVCLPPGVSWWGLMADPESYRKEGRRRLKEH